MSEQVTRHLSRLRHVPGIEKLASVGMGIEKESLRIDPDGYLSQTPHPAGLGSPLTHPSITTDFSEALLEFITPVCQTAGETLNYLHDLHTFTYGVMDPEELLWIASMPCIIERDDRIPLARYGSSNIGRLKTLYRSGLSYRYGRSMQAIAGIHFNFSLHDDFWSLYREHLGSQLNLQDFKTDQYFHMIRNFRRYSWLLLYLFGASPAVCESFVQNYPDHGLEPFPHGSLHAPYGTSLRMGDLGYTSKAQSELYISYNSLGEYAENLTRAIHTPYKPYERFAPERNPDGSYSYKQVNSSILQIENEFYSTIRPKRTATDGRKPVQALLDDGVEYIEVRLLDLNPFLPLGIDEKEIHFLSAFLMYCLFKESPRMDPGYSEEMNENLQKVVREGRRPGLVLHHNEVPLTLDTWARELLESAREVSGLLDDITGSKVYSQATSAQLDKVENSSLTPSARSLARMDEMKVPYFRFAMDQSLACSDYFRHQHLQPDTLQKFLQFTEQSEQQQAATEASDTLDFDTFLKQHNAS